MQDPSRGSGALVLDGFDPAAMSGALQQGSLEHTQLARGRFRGRVERSGGGGSRLDWGRYNLPLLVTGRVAKDGISVGYLRAARGEGSFNGQGVAAGDLAVLGENEEIYLRLPPETEWIALQVPREWLATCAGGPIQIPTGVWRPAAAARAALERTVCSLGRLLRPGSDRATDAAPEVVASAHDQLLCALVEALGPVGAGGRDLPGTRAQRVRIVRSAQDYAESRLGEPIRMPELCAAAGASLASLERAFSDVHGMGPKRFFTLHRLSRARRALIHGTGSPTTVTEAATACGFFHLGRFAQEYRALFREPPSATLRLARAAC